MGLSGTRRRGDRCCAGQPHRRLRGAGQPRTASGSTPAPRALPIARPARRSREDTIFRLASVTKPIVAATALRMVDLGLLSLDDPVTKYLPFFTPKAPDGSTPDITDPPPADPHLRPDLRERCPSDVTRGLGSQAADPARGESAAPGARRRWRSRRARAGQYGMSIDVLGGVIGAINGDISDVEARGAASTSPGPLGHERYALRA